MKLNFKNYAEFRGLLELHGALCVEGASDWAQGIRLPALSLDLPTMVRRARIAIVQQKRNPIFVQLGDGTQLFFTYDEFCRLKEKPEVGRMVLVRMTRLPGDASGLPSKIQSFQILKNL